MRHYPPRRARRNGSSRAWRTLRAQILERDGYRCKYCGSPANAVDHAVPYSLGGSDDPTNLVAACSVCNLQKGSS